ncbi:hypothetical protein M378DRAFT_163897, partial [Amanita muscaria Koide BX008]
MGKGGSARRLTTNSHARQEFLPTQTFPASFLPLAGPWQSFRRQRVDPPPPPWRPEGPFIDRKCAIL